MVVGAQNLFQRAQGDIQAKKNFPVITFLYLHRPLPLLPQYFPPLLPSHHPRAPQLGSRNS